MTDSEATVDLAFCLNRGHFVGVVPALRSILAHARRPETIAAHFAVGAGETEELLVRLEAAFPGGGLRYEIREFTAKPFLDRYIATGQPHTYAAPESQVMNFARFYLAEIYPELRRIAYLDVDIIARADLGELLALPSLDSATIAAVPIGTLESWQGAYDRDSSHLEGVDFSRPAFNNGIYVTDLGVWEARGIQDRLEAWMRKHESSIRDFVFGTQSIMNLAFHGDLELLPPEWNVRPLGYRTDMPEKALDTAKILHWAGPRKPWLDDGLYRERWIGYASS